MSETRLQVPPPGTHICGGSWEKMSERSRAELWDFHDYLSEGGRKAHGSFAEWTDKRSLFGERVAPSEETRSGQGAGDA